MNKKGIFFSLVVVIILLATVVYIDFQQQVRESESSFKVKRVQLQGVDDFVRRFERVDIPNMLASVTKIVLVEWSAREGVPLSDVKLKEVMMTGRTLENGQLKTIIPAPLNGVAPTTDNIRNSIVNTLTYPVTLTFDYNLESARQVVGDPILFEFDYRVTYKISAFDSTWEKNNMLITVQADPYGIETSNGVITSSSTYNPNGCLLEEIMTDVDFCAGGTLE